MAELSSALVSMFNNSIEVSMSEISPLQDWAFVGTEQASDGSLDEAVFLTMSSHLFRIFVAINFNRSSVRPLLLNALSQKSEIIDDNVSTDYLLELGNSVCGVFKRELGKHIPALGMSTPNLLKKESFSYMDSFHITSRHFQWIKFKNEPVFLCGYYYCPYVDKEIEIDLFSTTSDSDVGELELF